MDEIRTEFRRPYRRHHRDVDRRKDVGGGAQDRQHTHEQNQNRENEKGIRPLEGDFDDPHAVLTLLGEITSSRNNALLRVRNQPAE